MGSSGKELPNFYIHTELQLKSLKKILIGVQYEKKIQLLDKTHFAPAFSVV